MYVRDKWKNLLENVTYVELQYSKRSYIFLPWHFKGVVLLFYVRDMKKLAMYIKLWLVCCISLRVFFSLFMPNQYFVRFLDSFNVGRHLNTTQLLSHSSLVECGKELQGPK